MTPNDLTAEAAICILACASLIQQRLHRLIDCQNLQITVLKRLVSDGTHRPTDDERRVLAHLAHQLDRPRIDVALEALIVRLATENPHWGYATIAEAMPCGVMASRRKPSGVTMTGAGSLRPIGPASWPSTAPPGKSLTLK
ncbi:MAG: helix-turn-helix domain-containing protein, partial [Planctomycetota bacterium]|nr:helix-turn-helix domain-containing protein [Planctomycetota bacterium]